MSLDADGMSLSLQSRLIESFGEVKAQLEKKVHLLATDGDERLSQVALQITKQLFDLGVELETHSHPHVHPFLASISQPTGIELRSSSKKAAESDGALERVKPDEVLPHTPLSELTTDGLEPEQIWQQMELRAPGYVRVSKELTSSDEPVGMDEVELEHSEDGSEDMTEEEFREMLAEQGMDDLTEEEIAKMLQDAEDEGDSDEEEEDGDEDSEEEESEDGDEDDEDDEMSGSEGDEEEDEVTFEDGTKIGGSDEDDEDLDLDLDEEEEDVDEEEEDEVMGEEGSLSASDAGSADSAEEDEAGPSRAGPSKRRQHPTLDDQFFSIDDFNRMTEEAEASHLSSGRLNEDEDEELDEDVGDMMLRGASEDGPIMYGDFFDAPRTVQKPSGKAKIASGGKGKGKGKGKKARFEAEDEEEDPATDGDDEARDVMGRFKEDLFADDDDDEEAQPEAALSTHEKRQRALADQIAQLEQEAVGPKDWTLLGEASARARPENSLLEEDLDFEHVQKVTPVITEETVRTLEELIKKRILDNDFNSTVRVRAYEPTPFLPSRYFDLQDTQSSKSLAQIYEEEYQSAAAGGKASDPRDEKLKKEHQEIEDLWGEICYKLDALSSLNFVPKQPKAQITTISNLPTTSMETALPATSSTSTMLAPEELFQPATQSSLVARSELTPEEAQRLRERKRKAKKQERKHLGEMAELYGKKKGPGAGGVRAEKERALQGLVKSGKGVTVVGKGDKEVGKAGKRAGGGDGNDAREDAKRLKL